MRLVYSVGAGKEEVIFQTKDVEGVSETTKNRMVGYAIQNKLVDI